MRTLFSLLILACFGFARLSAALTLGVPEWSDIAPLAVPDESPSKAAVDAFNKGRHIEAASLARPLAEAGNAEALLIMGIVHQGDSSTELAIDYLRKAHQAGSRDAAYRLVPLLVARADDDSRQEAGKLLEALAEHDRGAASLRLGEGFLRGWFGGEPDFDRARQWWQQAAEKGDVAAMISLAGLLDGSFGFSEKRDPAAALEWYLKAAELDNPDAMASAGSRLLNGEESLRDEKAGREWLAKAIARDQADAWLALGDFEESMRKNDAAAFEQYRKGAEAGQSGCMLKLAEFLSEGRGGNKKNPVQALDWLKKAGDAGNALGHYRAATVLLAGEEPQTLEGLARLVAAAESGLPEVQNQVGEFYLSERLGFRDPTAAAGWFRRSAAAGDANGAYHLGLLYEQGIGVPRNAIEAGRLYARASNAGHPQATTAFGRLHAHGAGTRQNLPKAWALISLAIERGDEQARKPLDELTAQLTEEQVAKGRRLLAEFKESSK